MRVRRVLGGALLAVVGLLGVLLARTALFRSRQPHPQPALPLAGLVDDAAVQRLARAVQCQTVSYPDEDAAGKPMERKLDRAAFAGLREHLRASFPKVHAAASPELFAGDSLLFTLRGSDAALAPVVLLGHMDVVPVEPGTEGRWSAPPFSGAVVGGFIVGRGTLDDKSGVVATLEALELLLSQGFKPRRTMYLASAGRYSTERSKCARSFLFRMGSPSWRKRPSCRNRASMRRLRQTCCTSSAACPTKPARCCCSAIIRP